MKLKIESSEASSRDGQAIYEALLSDLGLSAGEVVEFLRENETRVREALSRPKAKV
ncbi:MAG: hypothetical protein IPK13_05770 [Deltaproteobacteria bacterium]|nr:hypothetical protein [Deltaproteobacteria bacterium]